VSIVALRHLASWAGRAPSRLICVAQPSWPWLHGRDARVTAWLAGGKGAGKLRMRRQESSIEVQRNAHGRHARATAATVRQLKKRVSNFEEQSHYVIENKEEGKKQSQNKPKLLPGNGPHPRGSGNPARSGSQPKRTFSARVRHPRKASISARILRTDSLDAEDI
jgi:hypothetical protein